MTESKNNSEKRGITEKFWPAVAIIVTLLLFLISAQRIVDARQDSKIDSRVTIDQYRLDRAEGNIQINKSLSSLQELIQADIKNLQKQLDRIEEKLGK